MSAYAKGVRKAAGPFIYHDYRDNHVICDGRDSALSNFVTKTYGGLQHKYRNAHSSNSEDALTWSCFDALWQAPVKARGEALLDLWGLAFPDRKPPANLLEARLELGKSYGGVDLTEVDASFEAPGLLVFIEAKLYSAMSTADALKGKPFDQLARKLRAGCRAACERNAEFYFIVLDIAPPEQLATLRPNVSLEEAERAKSAGFGSKWITAYWFRRYRKGSPLASVLKREPAVNGVRAQDLAGRIGWLTWADVFKVVLRAFVPRSSRGKITRGRF